LEVFLVVFLVAFDCFVFFVLAVVSVAKAASGTAVWQRPCESNVKRGHLWRRRPDPLAIAFKRRTILKPAVSSERE